MTKRPMALALISVLALGITGCEKTPPPVINTQAGTANHVRGVIADRDGPVTSGKILVTDSQGKLLVTIPVNDTGFYELELPAGTNYPVLLSCQVADELLEAVIIDASVKQLDLTHMSSLVVRSARDLGGITPANMTRAAGNAIAQSRTSNSARTTGGFNGDPTKQYGGWH